MADLGTEWALAWMRAGAEAITAHREELIDLDRAIGDGDHGENLTRGFTAVVTKLDGVEPATIGDVMKLVATTLMSTVGGAAGPLYGTAFLRAAKVSASATATAADVAAMLAAGLEGIVARGKAEVGDKTMVDAWTPAAAAAQQVADAGGSPAQALLAAADAAAAGAAATEPLVARKGRASYLGERAIGHRDPGSQSTALLLQAAAEAAQQAS